MYRVLPFGYFQFILQFLKIFNEDGRRWCIQSTSPSCFCVVIAQMLVPFHCIGGSAHSDCAYRCKMSCYFPFFPLHSVFQTWSFQNTKRSSSLLILTENLCVTLLKNEDDYMTSLLVCKYKWDRMFPVRMNLYFLIKLCSSWCTVGTCVYLLLVGVECNLLLEPDHLSVRLKGNDITLFLKKHRKFYFILGYVGRMKWRGEILNCFVPVFYRKCILYMMKVFLNR